MPLNHTESMLLDWDSSTISTMEVSSAKIHTNPSCKTFQNPLCVPGCNSQFENCSLQLNRQNWLYKKKLTLLKNSSNTWKTCSGFSIPQTGMCTYSHRDEETTEKVPKWIEKRWYYRCQLLWWRESNNHHAIKSKVTESQEHEQQIPEKLSCNHTPTTTQVFLLVTILIVSAGKCIDSKHFLFL
jgi:hypothetical protein